MSPSDSPPPGAATPDRELVRALYLALLGREPDASGLLEHLALLAGRPGTGAERLLPTLTVFLDSEEFRRHHAPGPAAPPPPATGEGIPASPAVPVPALPAVLSLGTHPAAASVLARAGLGGEALPFDGLRCPLSVVRHALEDDFATLLDPAWHGAPPPGFGRGRGGWHRFYEEELGARDLFARHDPTDPVTLAALGAACTRLRHRLVEPRPRLFLVLAGQGQVERGDFGRLLDTLGRLAAAPFRLLVLHVEEPEAGARGFAPLAASGEHRMLAFHPAGRLEPDGFALPADEALVRGQVEAARLEGWG